MLRDIKDTKIRKMIFCLFRYTDEKKNYKFFTSIFYSKYINKLMMFCPFFYLLQFSLNLGRQILCI
jgi:hypothetical protein